MELDEMWITPRKASSETKKPPREEPAESDDGSYEDHWYQVLRKRSEDEQPGE